jgi:hypothetical protein
MIPCYLHRAILRRWLRALRAWLTTPAPPWFAEALALALAAAAWGLR